MFADTNMKAWLETKAVAITWAPVFNSKPIKVYSLGEKDAGNLKKAIWYNEQGYAYTLIRGKGKNKLLPLPNGYDLI